MPISVKHFYELSVYVCAYIYYFLSILCVYMFIKPMPKGGFFKKSLRVTLEFIYCSLKSMFLKF